MIPADGMRIGVDIGGTFTDLVAVRKGSVFATAKTLTTPKDPSLGVLEALRSVLPQIDPSEVQEVVHATTLVPNALIERKGAITALITTRGFRDALAIGREHRYDMYDLKMTLPEPLVPRRRRWEVTERLLADGSVETALDASAVGEVAQRAVSEGVQAIAVCLLHSYRNSIHEDELARALAEQLPEVPVSLSSEIAPEIGEYVRASTTVANAYVQPLISRYLTLVEDRLKSLGIEAPVRVMLSTGGLSDLETGRRFPVRMVESGPAAGAIGAAYTAALAGADDILAFDMGGTTAKVCLVEGGHPLIAPEHEVARVHRFAAGSGLPIRLPVVDLIETGAGGGSVARVNRFGLPAVGPQSAGADPGPACYGRGGVEATVTDADLILGYLSADFFLGGAFPLDLTAARAAVGRFGERVGLDLYSAAAGIHRIVNENMAAGARMHAVERGRDLRAFAMVATGGAGPVHAWGVARALGISRILCPTGAGVASAFGMVAARPSFDYARSVPSSLGDVRWDEVRRAIAEMRCAGRRNLERAGVPAADMTVELSVDMRYEGQGAAMTVALGSELAKDAEAQLAYAFDSAYGSQYGRRPPGVHAEVLTWHVRVLGPEPVLSLVAPQSTGQLVKGTRRIWADEHKAFIEAQVIDRYQMSSSTVVEGPAVIEERESTVIVGPGGGAQLKESGTLMVFLND